MNRVEVEIMGQRLTVSSDEGEAHVRRVASYVDAQMRQLARTSANSGTGNLALLAALNIASEYWKLQDQQQEFHRTIHRLSERVLAQLDE
jgi:cell division protein ZapA